MAFNKIVLSGNQVSDYLYIQHDNPGEITSVDSEPTSWSDSTFLFASFNDEEHPLSAGNSELIGTIENYEVRRRKYDESYSEYVGTIRAKDDTGKAIDKKFLIDYAVKNNVDYTYYLYPNTDFSKSGTNLSPLITKNASIDCPYWSLFIVDETNEENVYYLDKMFKFELNLQIDDMNNNAQVSVVQNFTKYPTIQVGKLNYWSGSLSALCGFIASNGTDYVQKPNMINELKSITSDVRRKFLKDIDGNLWEVNVSSPINISTENMALQSVKTLKLSWTEVASAEGVSIIDNPNKKTYDWVITESGELLPYMSYVWGDQYIWDDSYYWTAREESNTQRITNLGREVKDGDV